MTRADKRFYALFLFFLISCASSRSLRYGPDDSSTTLLPERFSMFGDMRLTGFADGYHSFALKSSEAGTDFLLLDAMGSGFRNERTQDIASELVNALQGRSDFVKSVRRRENKIYFRFSANSFYMRKMTVFKSAGSPERIKLYFKKGAADIEIKDIAYEKD